MHILIIFFTHTVLTTYKVLNVIPRLNINEFQTRVPCVILRQGQCILIKISKKCFSVTLSLLDTHVRHALQTHLKMHFNDVWFGVYIAFKT